MFSGRFGISQSHVLAMTVSVRSDYTPLDHHHGVSFEDRGYGLITVFNSTEINDLLSTLVVCFEKRFRRQDDYRTRMAGNHTLNRTFVLHVRGSCTRAIFKYQTIFGTLRENEIARFERIFLT